MSGKVVGWAMEQNTGSATRKLILVKLADNSNEDGVCWPALSLIVKHTELSERAVRENLRALEDAGFIKTVPRKNGNGSATSSVYRLNLSGAPTAPGVGRQVPGGGAPGAGGGAQSAPGVGRQVPPEPSLTNLQLPVTEHISPETPVSGSEDTPPEVPEVKAPKPRAKPSKEEEPEFIEWYNAYPRKTDRGDALKAYRTMRKGGATVEELLAGAKRYAAERKGEDKNFTKGPAAWLRAKKWLDEPLLVINGHIATPSGSNDDPGNWLLPVWMSILDRYYGVTYSPAFSCWPNNAGPKPGQPGCKCPLECLKKYEDKVKAERRAA